MRAGIALGPNPLGKDDPGQDFTAGWGGGGPSKLSGAEVEAMTQCIGSLMTQAWAGGQTDIFSVEKLLWGPPSGTSLLPTSCRGSLGTKPWGVGFLLTQGRMKKEIISILQKCYLLLYKHLYCNHSFPGLSSLQY